LFIRYLFLFYKEIYYRKRANDHFILGWGGFFSSVFNIWKDINICIYILCFVVL
jgi:hypothetical protein